MEDKINIVSNYYKLIEDEVNNLQIPDKYIKKKALIIGNREEDELDFPTGNIADNEHTAFMNLCLNMGFRKREYRWAMGILLLTNELGSIDESDIMLENLGVFNHKDSDYSDIFWSSYGDFQAKSCSYFDSIGTYLAFAFFGIFDAPFYFNQVIDAINLKYTSGKRYILDGDPYKLDNRVSWKALLKAKNRYMKVRGRRDEIAHSFSPLMYIKVDEAGLDEKRLLLLRNPSLNSEICVKEAKETYFLLDIIPLAAADIAIDFIATDSYHRNWYLTD